MTIERDLVLHRWPPDAAGWAAFEREFLGRTPDCPQTAELIGLVQGEPVETERLHDHLARCAFCRNLFEGFREGWEEDLEPSPPSGNLHLSHIPSPLQQPDSRGASVPESSASSADHRPNGLSDN